MKKKIIKIGIVLSFCFSTLFGLSINYYDQGGIKIGADREALAFYSHPWKNAWKDCTSYIIVIGPNGPGSESTPGMMNRCTWASDDTCDMIVCTAIITPE